MVKGRTDSSIVSFCSSAQLHWRENPWAEACERGTSKWASEIQTETRQTGSRSPVRPKISFHPTAHSSGFSPPSLTHTHTKKNQSRIWPPKELSPRRDATAPSSETKQTNETDGLSPAPRRFERRCVWRCADDEYGPESGFVARDVVIYDSIRFVSTQLLRTPYSLARFPFLILDLPLYFTAPYFTSLRFFLLPLLPFLLILLILLGSTFTFTNEVSGWQITNTKSTTTLRL